VRQPGGGLRNEDFATFRPTNVTICFNAPDQCEDYVNTPVPAHTTPCTEQLNPCPAAQMYVCNTDFLCEVAAPGQPGAESLAQCNATCHRAAL
jgi:hypothetical protein